LTPEAEKRLGIRVVPAERKNVLRRRTLGGEVVLPPGQVLRVSAPLSGTLAAPVDGRARAAGDLVTAGETVFQLLPMLSPERQVLTPAEQAQMAQLRASLATLQIEAEQEVRSAQVTLEAAETSLRRATQLFQDKAGSRQAVDDAEAARSLARKRLEAAEARTGYLSKVKPDADSGQLQPQPIAAPVSGMITKLEAAAGETVVVGMLLFEVNCADRVWIRVPVYVGQWQEVDAGGAALMKQFGQPPEVPPTPIRPAPAPPGADAVAATMDLMYAADNPGGTLRLGQKVEVSVPLRDSGESLVVPWSAVIHDIQGGTWVYQRTAPQTFVRQRVAVRFVSDTLAVLASGPPSGAPIVADGAAELYGTEFGFAK
jgi:RND family efflux transporter MFP subunit